MSVEAAVLNGSPGREASPVKNFMPPHTTMADFKIVKKIGK
jgi:hypothetical protein